MTSGLIGAHLAHPTFRVCGSPAHSLPICLTNRPVLPARGKRLSLPCSQQDIPPHNSVACFASAVVRTS